MLVKDGETRLDPRMKRTRRMLQDALTELMHEKAFQSITVHDIAERATVNRATFYDHFSDKFALLEYSIRESFDEAIERRLSGDVHLSPETLRTLIEAVCEFMEEGSRHCKPVDLQLLRLVESQTTTNLVEVLVRLLEDARRDDAPDQTSVELTANLIGWAIFGAARHWLGDRSRPPAATFSAQMLPILTASLHHDFRVEGMMDEPATANVPAK